MAQRKSVGDKDAGLKSLEAIADTMPKSPDELVGLSSIGPKRAEKYGNEIIGIVDSFRGTHAGGNAEDGE